MGSSFVVFIISYTITMCLIAIVGVKLTNAWYKKEFERIVNGQNKRKHMRPLQKSGE